MNPTTITTTILLLLGVTAGAAPAQAPADWQARLAYDRWQAELADGTVIFECRLARLAGDTLVVREADTLRAVPLARLTALRLLRRGGKVGQRDPRGTQAALGGADDELWQLTLLSVPERRGVLEQVFREHPPQP